MQKIKIFLKYLFDKIKEHGLGGIIIFCLLLVIGTFIWRTWGAIAGESRLVIMAPLQDFFISIFTKITSVSLNIFGVENTTSQLTATTYGIYFPDIKGLLTIYPGCSGLSQFIFFIGFMIFYPGSKKKKLWFIPLGLLCVFIFRALLLNLVGFVFYYKFDYYEVVHDSTRYILWASLFLLWIVWVKWVDKKEK